MQFARIHTQERILIAMHIIMIGALNGAKPCMKLFWHLAYIIHLYIIRQDTVQAVGQVFAIKSLFHIKAKMIPYDEVEAYVGHAPGGVCPFGVNEGVAVYLDESLRKFDTVYPAAGNGHTAVKLTLQELEAAAGAEGWVDVCKEPEGE